MRPTGISRDSACGSSTIANVKSLFSLESRKLTAWFDFAAEPRNSLNKFEGRQCSNARAPFELICRRYPCKRSVGVLSLSNTATSMPICFRPCARQRPPVPAPTMITFDRITLLLACFSRLHSGRFHGCSYTHDFFLWGGRYNYLDWTTRAKVMTERPTLFLRRWEQKRLVVFC